MFASGGSDGSLLYWLAENPVPISQVLGAHDANIWALDWHPLGHLLCTGSNDYATRFWTRPRPGESEFINEVTTGAALGPSTSETVDQVACSDEDDGFYIPGFGTIGLLQDRQDALPSSPKANTNTCNAVPWRSDGGGSDRPPGLNGDYKQNYRYEPENERLDREQQRKRRREMYDDFFASKRRTGGNFPDRSSHYKPNS
jgi:polyadenylation factor subunit 2